MDSICCDAIRAQYQNQLFTDQVEYDSQKSCAASMEESESEMEGHHEECSIFG